MMKWWGWGDTQKMFDADVRPGFWPYVEKRLKGNTLKKTVLPDLKDMHLPKATINDDALKALQVILSSDQLAIDDFSRLQHVYGRNYRDLIRIWQNNIETAPDVIVYPQSHDDVVKIMQIASEFKLIIIPFGGGTNVVGALEVVPGLTRMVISMNMQRMCKVMSVDKESMLAVIEAGALGRGIEDQLNAQGLTLGHFPDSFEYASLGGWIAMRSAGMQSDGFGNIEDMLISVQVVTPTGEICTPTSPRFSAGPDIKEIILGSEGIFGVITQATVRIRRWENIVTHAVLFPTFETGLNVLKQCMRETDMPLMMRISDKDETSMSLALRPQSVWWKTKIQKILCKLITHVKKIDMEQASIAFLSFKETDKHKQTALLKRCRQQGAAILGPKIGEKWIKSKYEPPYIRDFFLGYGFTADTVETSALWSNILSLHDNTISAIKAMYAEKYNGAGYAGCHISHSYETGACLYFTICYDAGDEDKLAAYCKTKKYLVDTIFANGGSISHHHAIGYEHMPWATRFLGENSIKIIKHLKKNIDPDGVCNPGKLIPDEEILKYYWPNI